MLQSEQYAAWHQFFENISVSVQESYKALEQSLVDHKVPGAKAARFELPEGGPLSPKRLYLEVQREWLTYHICVAQFGTGFFVSSRLLAWPWEGWQAMIGIGTALSLMFLILVSALSAVGYNIIIAFVAAMIVASPFVLAFWIAVRAWMKRCQRLTYYRLDTMAAFQEVMHRIVVTHVNQVVKATGRKPLSDEERKPVLHKLLARH